MFPDTARQLLLRRGGGFCVMLFDVCLYSSLLFCPCRPASPWFCCLGSRWVEVCAVKQNRCCPSPVYFEMMRQCKVGLYWNVLACSSIAKGFVTSCCNSRSEGHGLPGCSRATATQEILCWYTNDMVMMPMRIRQLQRITLCGTNSK